MAADRKDDAGIEPGRIDSLRRKHYNATLLGERIHHGSVIVIRIKPDGHVPPPRPGQWLELGLGVWEPVREGAHPGAASRPGPDDLIRRAYSVSSPILTPSRDRLVREHEQTEFEFFLSLVIPPEARARRVPNLTGRLFCLRPGDRLYLSDQPMGEYSLDPVRPGQDVLFLATGTGEAPHNSMIWDLLRRGHPGRIASVVSVRHPDDLAYDAVHRRLTEMFPAYRYESIATRTPGADARHLQDLLRDGDLERIAGFPIRPGRTQVYLCGNPGLIGPPRQQGKNREFPPGPGMVELLEDRGLNADLRGLSVDIHYERYW